MRSGVRLDDLAGEIQDRDIRFWMKILEVVSEEEMPPEDEPQPSSEERRIVTDWIGEAIRLALSREREKNGSARRLTVAQYRRTLRDLLGLEEDLTEILPPDAISKDGFLNNAETLELSPLLVEAYFDIAEQALDLSLVDESSTPVIQNFRVDLGRGINTQPYPDKLILGANSHLLRNEDFVVSELVPSKLFSFESFRMRTKYRFIEGYRGNDTVRGWRDYDSIYHAVFACMRGTEGYPKGIAYETVPEGLLLRPAIPSAEIFEVESTYGPRANFKISLRELPDHGRFRVTVRAAKYDDGLLLERGSPAIDVDPERSLSSPLRSEPQRVEIIEAGVYQVDVHLAREAPPVPPDASRLDDALVGAWEFDGQLTSESIPGTKSLVGELAGEAKLVPSPFGEALSVDGQTGSVVVPRDASMDVGEGEFTVAAWIFPRELRQAGIVSLGGYGYTHGWLFDMPSGNGILRVETATAANQSNGTVASASGAIVRGEWQHVAAVIRRGENNARLFVNGREVASGTIHGANLDNSKRSLHIGRVEGANLFAGEIDAVRFYRRALAEAELEALVEPGRRFARAQRRKEKPQELSLQLGARSFSAKLERPAFLAVRLLAGPLRVSARYAGKTALESVTFTPVDEASELHNRFRVFEARSPHLGVHLGLRRDCGSTLNRVGEPQTVSSTNLEEFVFEGAINNFPSPDVEKDNVNYLAGVREIGVRSEYTDGRDMPRLLVRSVEFEGPLYESWPPDSHRRIFIESERRDDAPAYALDILRSFATRAYRRPVRDAELASLLAVWGEAFAESGDFRQSIKSALIVALSSPQFLFLIEDSATPEPEPLDSYELAAKLSYFLWDSPPDRRLLELAAENSLRRNLDVEITRLIRDPRFEIFADTFSSQWLGLEKLDVVEFDRERYPRLTRDTKFELGKEPARFVQHLVRENLSLSNLVRSSFILANEVVASYYDLGERTESGFEFAPVEHGSDHLGGVLAQAGILAALSDGRESHPIKRGAWLARKLIAEPPDDPPPNVPELPEDEGELSLREKLERHRNARGCKKCHEGIDPWGLPLEEFDAGGRYRPDRRGSGRSTLPDDTEISGANELKAYLVEGHIDQVAFSFLKHVATYATGRTLTYNELEFLRREGPRLKSRGYPMQDMVRFVVESELFLQK